MKTTIFILVMMVTACAAEAQSGWSICNSQTTQKFLCVFMPDENIVLAGSTGGTLLLSTNYGTTFNTIPLGSVEDINAIYFFNSQNGIMFLGKDFMKTTNGGLTWNLVNGIPGNPKAMHFLNPDTGFVACDLGEAYSTFTGGLTWNTLNTGVTERLEAVGFKHVTDVFFGGRNSTSLRTFNRGQSFTMGVIPANGDIKDILFVNPDNGFSCGDNGEILFTGNGGNNWSVQPTPAGEPGLDALHFTDEINGWCSGEAGTIFHTTNGGITWQKDNSNTVNELNNIHLFDKDHGFAVGDNGTIIRLGDGLTTVNEANTKLTSFTVSPNPARSKTTISYSISRNSDVRFKVFNMLGAEIKSLPEGMMDVGSHKLLLDVSDLQEGIYFYALQASGYDAKTGKLIISK